jgi:asparagine N-glycosylation enzyme membrane subunit Stt3
MILLLILLLVLVSAVVRIFTWPFRYGFRRRFYGCDPYYNPYRYGCRRHHRLLGGFLPIVALIALDRIFTRR